MSTLRVNTIQDTAGSGSPAINGLARAWVNFNGTGTVAIRAALNVSSITDVGTGSYTVNLTTAMPDSNYAVTMATRNAVTNTNTADNLMAASTTQISWLHVENSAATDSDFCCLAAFR